jgi:branched-chain amino acid transport system substrate-binding protein
MILSRHRATSPRKSVGPWVAACAIIAITITACSSSNTSGSAATGNSASAPGSASTGSAPASCTGVPAPCSTKDSPATGSPIHIGVTTVENDPIGDFTSAADGAAAATKYLNAHGGIDGHPVALNICAQTSTSGGDVCANSFVQDKDVAVIEGIVTQDNVMFPILKSAGIPVIGGSPLTPADFADDGNHWQFSGGPLSEFFAMPEYAARVLHIKSAVIVQPAAENGPTLTSYALTALKANGVTDVKVVDGPAATEDPTSTLVEADASHPDAIFFEYNPPACTTVMKDIQQLGITAKTFYFSSCNAQSVLSAAGSAANGIYTPADQLQPSFAADNPQVKIYESAMTTAGFASDLTQVVGELGFEAAMNFYAAAQSIGADKLNGESIDAYFAKTNNMPNWLADTYSCAQPPLPTIEKSLCGSAEQILEVENGKLTDIGGKWYI